jgi:hypothetical protein
MKKTLLLTSMVLLFAFAFGQPAIGIESRINPVPQQPCAAIFLPYSPQIVIAAMGKYKDEKQSTKERRANPKNYQSFDETSLIRNNRDEADLIFQVGLKNSDNKNASAVYLMLNSPAVGSGNDTRFDMEQAKTFLDNLAIAIRTYALNEQIKLQTYELSKANKKQQDLIAYGNKLDSKKAGLLLKPLSIDRRNMRRNQLLDRQIAENKFLQDVQKLEVEKQQTDLKILMNTMNTEKTNPKDA